MLLDIQVNLNKRPLTYIEDDNSHQPFTPNNMILGCHTISILVHEITSEDKAESSIVNEVIRVISQA